MTTIQRPAGQVSTWTYTANVTPTGVTATIYSDQARTVIAVASQNLAPVPGYPQRFTGSIPASLPAGNYYFVHQITTGAGTFADSNHALVLVAVSGGLTSDIDRLRRMVDETDVTNTLYTDEELQVYLDENTSVDGIDFNSAAVAVWEEKAGYFSGLVDISESGSSRKMSDLYKNAIAMAKLYGDKVTAALPAPAATVQRPKVNRIVRA